MEPAPRFAVPWDTAFWNFSWDEMAAHDLPALIDHVLNVTGAAQLMYVGVRLLDNQGLLFPPSCTRAQLHQWGTIGLHWCAMSI